MKQEKKNEYCEIGENGLIICKAKLGDKREITQYYNAPPDCIDIVEKDFLENIVKTKVTRELMEGNAWERTKGWFIEKPVKCKRQFKFKNEGGMRVLEEFGICEGDEERWKKGLRDIKEVLEII